MKQVEQLAAFVVGASFESLSAAARQDLKVRVLDSLGCAIGALQGEPVKLLRAQLDEFGGGEDGQRYQYLRREVQCTSRDPRKPNFAVERTGFFQHSLWRDSLHVPRRARGDRTARNF